MSAVGVLIWFEGATVRAHPILDNEGDALELVERLVEFARRVAYDPTLAECLSGLHSHLPGSCAKR